MPAKFQALPLNSSGGSVMSTLAAEERNERGEWSRLSAPGAAVGQQIKRLGPHSRLLRASQ